MPLYQLSTRADGLLRRHEAKVVLYKFYIRQPKGAKWDEPVVLTLHGERLHSNGFPL